jgi:hypothetical protein
VDVSSGELVVQILTEARAKELELARHNLAGDKKKKGGEK